MIKITDTAEQLLLSNFTRTANPTKYIAGFRTTRGREFALERARDSLFIWTENLPYPESLALSPPRHYSKDKTRNSNLNNKNSPRLILGKAVDYWKLESTEELNTLMDWYKTQ